MIPITLNRIKAQSPCRDGWEKLLQAKGREFDRDEEFCLSDIVASNNVADAAWVVENCDLKGTVPAFLQFAIYCAEDSLHIFEKSYPDDARPRRVIEAAKSGDATRASRAAARAAARAAVRAADAAARAAAEAAAYAADAAYAASDSADDAYAADAAYAAAYAADAAARAASAACAAKIEEYKQVLIKMIKEEDHDTNNAE